MGIVIMCITDSVNPFDTVDPIDQFNHVDLINQVILVNSIFEYKRIEHGKPKIWV